MKFEDLEHLSIEELINIDEAVSQVLKARYITMETRALSELTSLICKWYERGFSFYICTDEGAIPLYPSDICIERK